jgi:hypothetical protein
MARTKYGIGNAKGARAAIAGIGLGALLVSCANMLTGNDMTQKIGTDVATANAAQVSVHIQPDPNMSSAGTPSPLGDTTVKVGIPFSIFTTVDSAYVFKDWTQLGGAGEISFDSATSVSAKATVSKTGTGLTIQANYLQRPYIASTDPFAGNSVGINKTITIAFSVPVLASSLPPAANSIVVTSVPISGQATATPTDITSNFKFALIGSSGTTNPTATGILLSPNPFMGVEQYIKVTCKKAICDASGNTMASDNSNLVFTTGSSLVPAPTFTSASIVKGDGTALGSPDNALNSTTLGITVGAALSGSGQSIIDTRIIETALTPAGVPAGAPVTTDLGTYSSTAMPYTLQTGGTGYKLIQIELQDNYNQWTSPIGSASNLYGASIGGSTVYDTFKILYDNTSPAISSLSLNSGN